MAIFESLVCDLWARLGMNGFVRGSCPLLACGSCYFSAKMRKVIITAAFHSA
jgi:hypothetical protein